MIDKLEFLLALARAGHFGRAAEACGVTQPTLSAGIKQLEDSFGVLLVNRGSRFQNFTAEGERVLKWARRIVGDTRAMREEVHALKHGLSGRLRIAAIQTALAMIETLTTLYRERHPDVQFTVLSATAEEIFQLWKISKSTPGCPIWAASRPAESPAFRCIANVIACSLPPTLRSAIAAK